MELSAESLSKKARRSRSAPSLACYWNLENLLVTYLLKKRQGNEHRDYPDLHVEVQHLGADEGDLSSLLEPAALLEN